MACQRVPTERGTEFKAGVAVPRGQRGPQRVGLVEEPRGVRTRERGGHQAEGGQRTVAAAYVGIGEHHVVPGLAGRGLQR